MAVTGPILIIEDNKSDQGLLKSILDHLKTENKTVFFSNGIEALNYLKTTKEDPFLILSDFQMPEMNGIELIKTIYNDESLRKKTIPFIFFTGSANDETIKDAFIYHAQGFFIKEMEYEKLLKQIKLILDYWKSNQRESSF
jgi:CheY-like chemotaxis protein